jgi:hypothetical protein
VGRGQPEEVGQAALSAVAEVNPFQIARFDSHGTQTTTAVVTRSKVEIEHWPLDRIRPYQNNPRVLRNAAEKVAAGLPEDEICQRLGMEAEELERLLDRSGMTVRGSRNAVNFGSAWIPGRNL